MKLIFADNTEMEIKNIFGNPEYVQGFNRDVLTIEIDPKVAELCDAGEIETITTTNLESVGLPE